MTDLTEAGKLRLRTIARNAVTQARIVIDRNHGPWLDSDIQADELIAEVLLRMQLPEDVAGDADTHEPLRPATEPKVDAALARVHKALEELTI
jgi:hypothetical protein